MYFHDKKNFVRSRLTTDYTFATWNWDAILLEIDDFTLTKPAVKDYIRALQVEWMRENQIESGCTGGVRMKFFLCVVGMVMIIEGLPYFAFPEKMKFWIQKIAATPDGSLRRFGLVLMVLGLVLVYWGRN
jgi:uncharacterized protein YjeT (DUF2065 family)